MQIQIVRIGLMVLTVTLGLFEPDGLHPESSSALPATNLSSETAIPPVIRGGHTGASIYSDTTRSRRLNSELNVPRRFEDVLLQSTAMRIRVRLLLGESHTVSHLNFKMDHQASSPGRWRC